MQANINLDSKAVRKLIGVLSSGVGAIAAPWLIRAKASAEADALLTIASAQAQAQVMLNGSVAELAPDGDGSLDTEIEISQGTSAIRSRILYQEAKRQRNIADIAGIAIDEIPDDVSDEPVDEDWIARFFNHAQDISSEKMQQIWAKILSGEIYRPGSFSMRTLDTLRNISPNEAKLISSLNPLLMNNGKQLFKSDNTDQKFDISVANELLLKEIGIIETGSGLGLEYKMSKMDGIDSFSLITFGNIVLILDNIDEKSTLSLKVHGLTTQGSEILSTLEPEHNEDVIEEAVKVIKSSGFTVKRANMISRDGAKFSIDTPMIL